MNLPEQAILPHPDKRPEDFTREERMAVLAAAKQASQALVKHIERLEQIDRELGGGRGDSGAD